MPNYRQTIGKRLPISRQTLPNNLPNCWQKLTVRQPLHATSALGYWPAADDARKERGLLLQSFCNILLEEKQNASNLSVAQRTRRAVGLGGCACSARASFFSACLSVQPVTACYSQPLCSVSTPRIHCVCFRRRHRDQRSAATGNL